MAFLPFLGRSYNNVFCVWVHASCDTLTDSAWESERRKTDFFVRPSLRKAYATLVASLCFESGSILYCPMTSCDSHLIIICDPHHLSRLIQPDTFTLIHLYPLPFDKGYYWCISSLQEIER